jgi:hypothetical protein
MTILGLSILPPLAIGRLGSAAEPLENYDLVVPGDGLDYRRIVPIETLYVDPASGAIARSQTPKSIRFRDGDRIRPVAPFLEVFAHMDDGSIRPLTCDLLRDNGLDETMVQWTVEVGNIKAFRRTGDPGDKALARVTFSDHDVHVLEATAGHFIKGKVLPLGHVRYIRPNAAFPEIRLRFTPAAGLVYGASEKRIEINAFNEKVSVPDPIIAERIIYDPNSPGQKWLGWVDTGDPDTTNPGAIYAGYNDPQNGQTSWGYLDDECDGIVTVSLALPGGQSLSAFARIGAGPPDFAPDGLPVRTVHDELLQALLGRDVSPTDVTPGEAEDIVRRAAETVRLMNTTVMNGNTVGGRQAAASMMPSQDANDTHRMFAPVMASGIVDNRAILALHQAVLAALRAGSAPWFTDLLRQPEEIGDLSDAGRRKMPALMRGADARYLTLTRRQIDTIGTVAAAAPFAPRWPSAMVPKNLTALKDQLAYRGRGNPPVSHPTSAISNCFPGLEFDFRNIWRRIFKGIVLTEHSNFVTAADDPALSDLVGRRLLAINNNPVMTQATGPSIPGRGTAPLPVDGNPQAVAFMEWSNNFALIQDQQGKKVSCVFTQDPSNQEVLWPIPSGSTLATRTVDLEVRRIFDVVQMGGTEWTRSVLGLALAEPGELTQGLCSPWQNDYRECACYYWAASRPDYVNIEAAADGASRGAMWLQKDRDADYVLDDRIDERLYNYDDLFREWEKVLHFVIRGRDASGTDA